MCRPSNTERIIFFDEKDTEIGVQDKVPSPVTLTTDFVAVYHPQYRFSGAFPLVFR
jgi:hypothetical protein